METGTSVKGRTGLDLFDEATFAVWTSNVAVAQVVNKVDAAIAPL